MGQGSEDVQEEGPLCPPELLATVLPAGIDVERVATADDPEALARRSVAWSRAGRVDVALALLDRVAASAPPDGPARAALERAQVLRELGLAARAEALEGPALALGPSAGVAALLATGLVADAVGRGDLAVAEERLARAGALVGALAPGEDADRAALRLTWVAVEVALLAGRPPDPLVRAGLPTRGPEGLRWPSGLERASVSDRAKALLFAGVVDRDGELLTAAAALAPPMLGWAVELARSDVLADPASLARARAGWSRLRVPPTLAGPVADGPVGRRLGPVGSSGPLGRLPHDDPG